MAKLRTGPARSNSPQALSVVTVTHEGNVPLTVQEIMKFDGKIIGFSHARTWAAMPASLRGVLDPEAVLIQLKACHPRVARSIAALCDLGVRRPVTTHNLRDHPDAGLREVEDIRIGPAVKVLAKATCWYVDAGQAVIPILQPRMSRLPIEKLGIYVSLARKAFCRGDWARARLEIIDLSGELGADVVARVIPEGDLPSIEDGRLQEFLQTYVQAQAIVAKLRAERAGEQPEPRKPPADDLFAEDNPPKSSG